MQGYLACRQSIAEGDFEGQVVGKLLQQVPMPQPAIPHVLLAVLCASLVSILARPWYALSQTNAWLRASIL